MRYCPNCGNEIVPGDNFCRVCGEDIRHHINNNGGSNKNNNGCDDGCGCDHPFIDGCLIGGCLASMLGS